MVTRYDNLIDMLDSAFESFPEHPAYTCLGHTLSYAELDRKSEHFARFLQHDLKLKPGDRFAIQLPNVLQFPIALYGAIRAGVVVVNINPLYTPRELLHQLNDSGARALLVLANVAHNAAEIVDQTGVGRVIVTEIADEHPAPKRYIINWVCKYIKKMVPKYSFRNQQTYLDVFSQEYPERIVPEVNGDTLLVLQYTGGTTGVSKGAMLSHRNLASNVWQMISHMPQAFEVGKETFVACLPLYHIYALNLHGLSAFSMGCHNILIPNPRDLDSIIKALCNVSFTVFIGINTLFRALVRFEPFKGLDFSKLKVTSAGGMALTEDAAVDWHTITGCKVIEGYGLTETSPVLTGNPYEDIRLGSIGTPLPDTDIKILDDDGNELPDGEAGELCAKGPQVMAGYWNRDDETRAVMTESGYFRTGDMAEKMPGGYFRIVDRKKDIIIVSGFNVYPNEIEDILTQHPDIVEAAAVGIPDAESGEVVKVFIVAELDDLTKEEIRNYCKEQLTPYKVPKEVEFRKELPKSNVGKILRRELRSDIKG